MAIQKLFNQMLSSPGAQGAAGGAASAALVTALLNKKARKKLVGGAAKVGGLAALAGVGYLAYQKFKKPGPEAASTPAGPTAPATPQQLGLESAAESAPVISETLGMMILQAMIASANADGNIDSSEMDTLFEAIHEAGLTPEENARITASLNSPPTAEDIASKVNSQEEAAEVYGAAVVAIDCDTPAEHLFLKRLAHLLHLDRELVAMIHQSAEAQ